MLQRIWPIAAVVLFNTLYNICAKSTPENVNAFASLFLTYVTAALGALGMFFCTGGKGLFENFGKANWTAYLLGLSLVGLEAGFISIYRAGWKISVAQLISSCALACVLPAVGLLFYRETISLRQCVGLCLAGAGLILLAQ